MWEEMGADCVMLDSLLVNREFEVLRAIRKAVKVELQLLVSNNCMQSCAMSPAHMNALATPPRAATIPRVLHRLCFLQCTAMKLQNPVNYIRSEWIRPRICTSTRSSGTTRSRSPSAARRRTSRQSREGWTDRRYDGNLLELIQPYGFREVRTRRREEFPVAPEARLPAVHGQSATPLEREDADGGARMLGAKDGPPPVQIDNRALDGFMERSGRPGARTWTAIRAATVTSGRRRRS